MVGRKKSNRRASTRVIVGCEERYGLRKGTT
jgi:hypothetical protein